MLVSPEEPTISASVRDFPVLREFRERAHNAPKGEQLAAEQSNWAGEPLALEARAAWARGDAAALSRAGRRMFRLAGAETGPPVAASPDGGAPGAAGGIQALARDVLALGDLAAGRLTAPAAVTLPWAADPALWLPPRLVPELLGDDFGTYRSCAILLEQLRASRAGGDGRGGGGGGGASWAGPTHGEGARTGGGGHGVGQALPAVLGQLTSSAVALGRWSAASDHAREGLALARLTGQAVEAAGLLAQLAWIAAARGRAAECRRLAAEALAIAAPRGCTLVTATVKWALGLLELGLGRPAQALDRLAPLASSSGSTPVLLLATADLVEAAVRSGRRAAAEPLLAQLDRWVEIAGPAWALAAAFRCRSLLADGDEAEFCFQAALDSGGGSVRPFGHARTELDYGTWLRRTGRWVEARSHLRAAMETFERLGTSPWTERTWVEMPPHDRRAGAFRGGGVRPAARGRC